MLETIAWERETYRQATLESLLEEEELLKECTSPLLEGVLQAVYLPNHEGYVRSSLNAATCGISEALLSFFPKSSQKQNLYPVSGIDSLFPRTKIRDLLRVPRHQHTDKARRSLNERRQHLDFSEELAREHDDYVEPAERSSVVSRPPGQRDDTALFKTAHGTPGMGDAEGLADLSDGPERALDEQAQNNVEMIDARERIVCLQPDTAQEVDELVPPGVCLGVDEQMRVVRFAHLLEIRALMSCGLIRYQHPGSHFSSRQWHCLSPASLRRRRAVSVRCGFSLIGRVENPERTNPSARVDSAPRTG